MANPLEAGFSEDHRGKIRKPPRESVIRNIISPAIEEDRAHGSFQDYLDINKAHVLMLARQGIITEEVEKSILTATDKMAAMGPEPDFPLDPRLEDMYFNLERHLIEMTSLEIGGAAAYGALPERSLRDLCPHGVPPVLFCGVRPLYRDAEIDPRAR